MRPRAYLPLALARVALSLLGAGVFYLAWLAAILLITGSPGGPWEVVLWLSAPVVTAAGFAVGILVSQPLTKTKKARFLRIFIWPLAGCAIGAGVVYWFGPMLIVFGMFAAGTASVVLREVIILAGQRPA